MTRRRGHGEGAIYRTADGRWRAAVELGWEDGKRKRHNLNGRTREEVAASCGKHSRPWTPGCRCWTDVPRRSASTSRFTSTRSPRRSCVPARWRHTAGTSRTVSTPPLVTIGFPSWDRSTWSACTRRCAPRVSLPRPCGRSTGSCPGRLRSPCSAISSPATSPPSWTPHPFAAWRSSRSPPSRHERSSTQPGETGTRPAGLSRWPWGLRQGEALGLSWDAVDLDADTLTVREALQRAAWQHGCPDPQSAAAATSPPHGR